MKAHTHIEPRSIDACARALGVDRRTLSDALRSAGEVDYIMPIDHRGTRSSPRWQLSDACEALELQRVRAAPMDERKWCPRLAAEYDKALELPCPRCGGHHVETPILPLQGKKDKAEIMAWWKENGIQG